MRRLHLGFFGVMVLGASVAGIEACGGDAATTPGAGDAGSDGTVADAPAGDTSSLGKDSAPPPIDTGVVDTGGGGGDAATCGQMATAKACFQCCAAASPNGAKTYQMAVYQCACSSPALCGPIDGGAPDAAAAGGLGKGACTATCTMQTPPDQACKACARETMAPDGGACDQQVNAACAASADCVAFAECTKTCP